MLILEVVMSGEVQVGIHACWTMSGEVRRVKLRAGRSVELDHERIGWWKHDNP